MMKVRYSMLGDVVYPATLVESPSQFSRSATEQVLELDAEAPLQISPPAADVEVVDATDAEWEALQAAGYACKRMR